MSLDSIYDRADALSRLDGDEELFASVVQIFVSEHMSYCQALEAALAASNAAELRREAHSLKSMLATFSFASGVAQALALENLAATGDLTGAVELTGRVIAATLELAGALGKEYA